VRDENHVSCFIYKRTGEVELIRSSRARAAELPGVPTIAGLVPVADVMTREVVCALADVPIGTVIDLVVNNQIGCVPIVDDDGCPIGMITKRDLVAPLANRVDTAEDSPAWWTLAPRTAEEAMLPLAFSLDERATVAQAAAMMAAEDLHHVPIVSARGRLVGLVSSLDVVRWLARNDGVVPSGDQRSAQDASGPPNAPMSGGVPSGSITSPL
jgi:CBS domain-containing protein